MITDNEIIEIGKLIKPHGINGEIVATIDFDIDLKALKCIIIDRDGINVPFFIKTLRTKGKGSILITIEGVENECDASLICGNSMFALKHDCPIDTNEDGFYATDLIGFKIQEDNEIIGEIIDIEDSTENALFIVKRPNENILYIPIVDEFIIRISTETSIIEMDLPSGIIEL